jgi:hypothetical protein
MHQLVKARAPIEPMENAFGKRFSSRGADGYFFLFVHGLPLIALADFFLVGHIGSEIFKVDLQFAVFELGGQSIHRARGRAKDV